MKEKTVSSFIKETLDIEVPYLYEHNDVYSFSFSPLPDLGRGVLRYGTLIGSFRQKRFEPSHYFFRDVNLQGHYRFTTGLSDEEYARYIAGEELARDLPEEVYSVAHKGITLGYGNVKKGRLKNKYPKGLRRMV